MPLNVLAIYREEKYSNRAIDADKAILDSVLKNIRHKMGRDAVVVVLRAEELNPETCDFNFDLVFSMAQDEKVLKVIDLLEKNGAVVVNSGKAIRNCYRNKLSQLLDDENFSYPQYKTINVTEEIENIFNSESGYWVKRGDFHALVDDDVTHILSLDELTSVLARFKERGVEEIILQKNCEGELFKFYGVKDSFFHLRYMGKTGQDRYHSEPGNPDIDFDHKRLEELAHKAAHILELDYFGGDCIITANGGMHFIDFNDWPSFRTCLNDVAPIMVSYALNKLNGEVFNDSCINQ